MTLKEDHENPHELSHEAQELILHGDNTAHLYHRSKVPVMQNLEKKHRKGVYDHDKAKKLWAYHADRVAQDYTKTHGHAGGPKWHEMFSTKHRRQAAAHWADQHAAEMSHGNFHEETGTNFAAEIVYAAMEAKPVQANENFAAAVKERSKALVDDKKCDLSGKFMEAFELNPAKKGMWAGYSKAGIEKAKAKAKADHDVTREREATFALNAKNHFKKGA